MYRNIPMYVVVWQYSTLSSNMLAQFDAFPYKEYTLTDIILFSLATMSIATCLPGRLAPRN